MYQYDIWSRCTTETGSGKMPEGLSNKRKAPVFPMRKLRHGGTSRVTSLAMRSQGKTLSPAELTDELIHL